MLTQEDKYNLINLFINYTKNTKFSYDTILHNNQIADYYLIIPKGKKNVIWFTYYKENNLCLVLELNNNKNISKIYSIKYCFTNEVAFNTILYGTFVINKNTSFFVCEDILFYKNIECQYFYYKQKLNLLNELFTYNIKNTNLSNFIISLPIIKKSYSKAYDICQYLPYDIYGIQHRVINKYYSIGIIKNNYNIIENNFIVRANINPDIYNLFYIEDKREIFYNIAMIPDYKTSIFMNNIFRKIRENQNLDLLEESDSEDDFQNNREDKFVDLNKSVIMKCIYINKFKKWKPISITLNSNANIITKKDLLKLNI